MASDNMIALLRQAGFEGESLRQAWAIMMRESGGNPQAFNGNRDTGDQSYGLFQINMLGSLGPARLKQLGLKSNEDLLNPMVNARAAYRMSQGGKDWGAWAIGPNAYKGAPANAKQKYLDWYKKFPGGGGSLPDDTSYMGGDPPTDRPAPNGVPDTLAEQRRMMLGWAMNRGGDRLSETANLVRQLNSLGSGSQALRSAPVAAQDMSEAAPTRTTSGNGQDINELFYDPAGAYDEGKWINPIGGHSDHVHASFGSPQAAMYATRMAQQMGLRASENPYAEGSPAEKGVHTDTSYHYQTFPGVYKGGKSTTLGRGLDVSGDSELMRKFFDDLVRRYSLR